jgi:hypothetical protein
VEGAVYFWDHADGMDLFPNARIWIQKDELQYYAGEAWQSKDTHDGIDAEDVLTLVKLNTLGRVGMVNGDAQEIVPGVTCYTGGRHTYASQYVGVTTSAGILVLASDNMYLYENLEKHVPVAATLDAVSNPACAGPYETTPPLAPDSLFLGTTRRDGEVSESCSGDRSDRMIARSV